MCAFSCTAFQMHYISRSKMDSKSFAQVLYVVNNVFCCKKINKKRVWKSMKMREFVTLCSVTPVHVPGSGT